MEFHHLLKDSAAGDRKRSIVGSNRVAARVQAVGECKTIPLEEIEEKDSF